MKKPIASKNPRLQLSRSTLRVLSRDQLRRVNGGSANQAELTSDYESTLTVTVGTCGPECVSVEVCSE